MTGAGVLACLALLAPPAAATDVYMTLEGKGGGSQPALALPRFAAEDPRRTEDSALAAALHEVVRSDLLLSRHVRLGEDGPLFTGANVQEVAAAHKKGGAAWLLVGRAARRGAQISLTLRLENLPSGEAAFERYFRQAAAYPRSLAHRAADDVIGAITGRPGIAQTRIAFSASQSGAKEIFVVDYDGADPVQLTRHRSIALLPRFAPDRRRIAYTAYHKGNPDLYLLDLQRGDSAVLSAEQGLNVAGGFSPDGTQLLLTLSRQGNPNLYVKRLPDGALSRLTQHYGVDSSPTFSPDASLVAFVSDRTGNPQVYVLNATTLKTRRLTQTMNWCDAPAWSPTGEWIAFAGRLAPRDPLDIYLVDVTGSVLRRLTKGEGSNEDPSWSPDGRFLAFTSTRQGRPQIYVMDADGSAPHQLLEVPGSAHTPHWSR